MFHYFVYLWNGLGWTRTHGPYRTQERAECIARGYSSTDHYIAHETM